MKTILEMAVIAALGAFITLCLIGVAEARTITNPDKVQCGIEGFAVTNPSGSSDENGTLFREIEVVYSAARGVRQVVAHGWAGTRSTWMPFGGGWCLVVESGLLFVEEE